MTAVTTNGATAVVGDNVDEQDPYRALEELEGEAAQEFVRFSNQMCLLGLGDPTQSETYPRILKALQADDRLPLVSQLGVNTTTGEPELYNLWKDKKHQRGIWRKTTLSSYETDAPEWTTVLDLDQLAETEGIPWVWRTSRILPRARDTLSNNNGGVTRVLISLSRTDDVDSGDPNAVVVREFDLLSCSFVAPKDGGFYVPLGNTRASYKSRDVLSVVSDAEGGGVTNTGYPRTIREWVRGTALKDAPVVMEGETSDLAVSTHIDDQRVRGGGLYEVQTRALNGNSSKIFVRKIKPENLLARNDPPQKDAVDPPIFKQLQVPDTSEIDFVGNLLVISLRSDWSPEDGKLFPQGSVVYVNTHKFLKYGPKDRIYHVLFKPKDRVVCETYTVTKEFVVLSIIDTMKSKLEFFKLEKDANKLRLVGSDKKPQIRSVNVRPVDPCEGDELWLTTAGYTEPTTLWLADASKMDSPDKKVAHKTDPEGYLVRKIASLPEQFDASDMEVTQKIVRSKDGTEVAYFMVYKNLVRDGNNPTLLYGYGGFGVTLGPHYTAPTGISWLERGGVYVEANIRGGGEFGGSWHDAGRRENRIKAYEDFIAVAEDLISSNICKPRTLAIRGGSVGGLLVANMYVMRPDLFGALHCAVPVLDMRQFKAMGATKSWIRELGDPDTDDWKIFLKKFSPYHNIDESVKKRPPILLTASTWDNNEHPGHARKMANRLLDIGQGKKWPVYYYENTEVDSCTPDATQYAFLTALSFEFMYKTLVKQIK